MTRLLYNDQLLYDWQQSLDEQKGFHTNLCLVTFLNPMPLSIFCLNLTILYHARTLKKNFKQSPSLHEKCSLFMCMPAHLTIKQTVIDSNELKSI